MIIRVFLGFALFQWIALSPLMAGQFKRIEIDGRFDDWLGVPLNAEVESDGPDAYDIRDVAVANDDDFLYIRLRLHSPGNYTQFHHQVLVDTDADSGTGHAWGGLGSELFIENGFSYQQKNGQFNEGGGSQLGWLVAIASDGLTIEMRLSRTALDAEGLPFFSQAEISLSIQAQTLDWQLAESVQAIPYQFATQPQPFQGNATLVDWTDSFWFYQEVGDPAVPDWLLPDYLGDDTWKGETGFFSHGFSADVHPVDKQIALAPGRTAYYFRTPFQWEHAAEGVALNAEVYLSDGAILYLNGDEVRRVRMPEGPIDGGTQALASHPSPGQTESFALPATALISGENLLMVEVHQAEDSLDSLAFGLRLTASDNQAPRQEEPDFPKDREIFEGESTRFELGTLAGTAPFTYQWFKNGEPLEGATGIRLELPIVTDDDAGVYFAEISNPSGSVRTREARLTTTALPVTLTDFGQPLGGSVLQGEAFTLTVSPEGSPPFTYQWFLNEALVEGATQASHTILNASSADAGAYHVAIGNRVSTLSSQPAILDVISDEAGPTLEQVQAGSQTVTLSFNEILSSETATRTDAYTIDGLEVLDVTLQEDLKTVILTTTPMGFGGVHHLNIQGIADRFGNTSTLDYPIQASILIDGDFSDWVGIEPSATDPMDVSGSEFHQFWAVHDESFLYLRFSFHEAIGPLPGQFYYQIFIDGDSDPATGLPVNGLGSSLMIENGSGWMQAGGTFNEGSVSDTGFALAPQGRSREFECRIALGTSKDGAALLTGDHLGITFHLVSTSWEVLDAGPAEVPLSLPIVPFTPTDPNPSPAHPLLEIELVDGQVELSWEDGTLETSPTLKKASWDPLPEASSPYRIQPSDPPNAFFRLNH